MKSYRKKTVSNRKRRFPDKNRRNLSVRVKTARGRKNSSTKWLQRQLNDPYVVAAQQAGLRSRAVFKLEQLNTKFKFLKPKMKIVELGAAPGGWTQFLVKTLNTDRPGSESQRTTTMIFSSL